MCAETCRSAGCVSIRSHTGRPPVDQRPPNERALVDQRRVSGGRPAARPHRPVGDCRSRVDPIDAGHPVQAIGHSPLAGGASRQVLDEGVDQSRHADQVAVPQATGLFDYGNVPTSDGSAGPSVRWDDHSQTANMVVRLLEGQRGRGQTAIRSRGGVVEQTNDFGDQLRGDRDARTRSTGHVPRIHPSSLGSSPRDRNLVPSVEQCGGRTGDAARTCTAEQPEGGRRHRRWFSPCRRHGDASFPRGFAIAIRAARLGTHATPWMSRC